MPATARVCEGDPKTVLQGVVEAAEPLQAFARSVLCDVHRRQGLRDALSAVRRAVQDGARGAYESLQRRARSPPGVWTAMDPDHTRRLVIAVGPRSVARAQRGVPQGVRSEEHTSELQSRVELVCSLLLENKKKLNSPKHRPQRSRTSYDTTRKLGRK